jgi:hypothetical protein
MQYLRVRHTTTRVRARRNRSACRPLALPPFARNKRNNFRTASQSLCEPLSRAGVVSGCDASLYSQKPCPQRALPRQRRRNSSAHEHNALTRATV